MNNGFIPVATATPRMEVANCPSNVKQIISLLEDANTQHVALLVFPELCITGYTCGDLFFQTTLIDCAWAQLQAICKATQSCNTIGIVGLPVRHGSQLYNCSAVIQSGAILGIVPKASLSNKNGIDEHRYFSVLENTTCLDHKGIPFGYLTFVCNEYASFSFAIEIGDDSLAFVPPASSYVQQGATIIARPAATVANHSKKDLHAVQAQSSHFACGYIHSNAGYGESSTDTVFIAQNAIFENGEILAQADNESALLVCDIDVERIQQERIQRAPFPSMQGTHITFSSPLSANEFIHRTIPAYPFCVGADYDAIMNIQSLSLQKRLAHTKAQKIVLGISGGLDSTLTLLVSVQALQAMARPVTDIYAVTMPCFGTTQRTKGNAERLCEELGVPLRCIDISASVSQHFLDIGHDESLHNATFENAQARERTQILMDIANDENGLVVGTGDLSELALGWATYNGDHMSMYGVNGSVSKTLIQHIIQYKAEQSSDALRAVLLDIVATPVSPELLPPSADGTIEQKTEDLVGPYALHDFFLYYVVRWGFSPTKIYRMAKQAFASQYDADYILCWLQTFYYRFFSQQFKRSCQPDGPCVGDVSLSPRGAWQMPSDAVSAIWLQELETISSH